MAALLAACGGSATPAPAGGGSGSGAGAPAAGQLSVTFGSDSKTYSITACVEAGGALTIAAGNTTSDGAALVISNTAGVPTAVGGYYGGKPWAGGPDAKGSYSGKSGQFSATDVASNTKVSGTFTCK
jgi:hypothetical protein